MVLDFKILDLETKESTRTFVLRVHPIVIEFFVDDAMLIVNL